ncbi:MAG: hypothetical protein NUV98_01625 [Candidatus Roizmanbacteria bacterium]|nr:hypothetical protein [Candidatus Roizmanbacteria bacterium]
MRAVLDKLEISVNHLKCLDDVFRANSPLYLSIENSLTNALGGNLIDIERELYAGGKSKNGLHRQMILGDIIEYIFSGRAYYYAAKSEDNFNRFSTLVLYCVNQLLLFDTITVNPQIRRTYIEQLERVIPLEQLYEKEGDRELAQELKASDVVIWQDAWERYDALVDSLLPKTLGTPKELVVFLELIRLNKGLVIPLLLIQRLFGDGKAIAPPDFLLLKRNREIFGLELGYAKEGQSREFSVRTSIPTFGIDLTNHMHNRCPKCGENILYCDTVIQKYSDGSLWRDLNPEGRFICNRTCQNFNGRFCTFANYYGKYRGNCFYGNQKPGDERKDMHYHAKCVVDDSYDFRGRPRNISEHIAEFFSQIPVIEGIDNI